MENKVSQILHLEICSFDISMGMKLFIIRHYGKALIDSYELIKVEFFLFDFGEDYSIAHYPIPTSLKEVGVVSCALILCTSTINVHLSLSVNITFLKWEYEAGLLQKIILPNFFT